MADRPRLGELLCRRGMLDEDRLGQALDNQVVYGARLGTNLVELGLARLDDVARCLVVQRGLPQADPETISTVTPQTLALLPIEICLKYELFPLGRDDQAVHVAMTDPTDELVARLSAYFGDQAVKPYIVPELRLHFWLEQHYGHPRPKRFLRTPDGGEHSARQRTYLAPTIDISASSSSARVVRGPRPGPQIEDSARIVFAPVKDTGLHGAVGDVPETLPSASQTHPDLVYLDEFHDHSAALSPQVPQQARRPVDEVLEQLDRAISGSEIASALVAPLCPETALSVLFWVRGDLAVACHARGAAVDQARVAELVLSLDRPSVFQWALTLQGVVRAAGEGDACQQLIAQFLGTLPPAEVCVAPVWLEGKVVNLVCVHSKPGVPLPEAIVGDLRTVADHAQQAYLQLKTRIRGG